jgi:siroheme synthase-like protein
MPTQIRNESRRPDAPGAGKPRLFPVALKLAGARCLVVGGGPVALRKVHDLLACGARIHVVSPDWLPDFERLERQGDVTRATRGFVPADLHGARVVVAATDDPEVQRLVAAEADARSIPCNVVDVNHLCSFYVPAVLRRGDLTVAVTTDGKFPLLAAALRDRIAAAVSANAGDALDTLAEARQRASAAFPADPAARLAALKALLTERALDHILAGEIDELDAWFEVWKATLPGATS